MTARCSQCRALFVPTHPRAARCKACACANTQDWYRRHAEYAKACMRWRNAHRGQGERAQWRSHGHKAAA